MKVITCECGYVVRGDTDDELVRRGLEHIRTAHPTLAGQVSSEQLLAMAEVVA